MPVENANAGMCRLGLEADAQAVNREPNGIRQRHAPAVVRVRRESLESMSPVIPPPLANRKLS